MARITEAQLHFSLSKLLKFSDESSMPDFWDEIVSEAATFAYNEVRGRLEARGFSRANVDGWDRLEEVTRDLGLWRSIVMGGVYSSFDAKFLASLDRREELSHVLVAVSDVWVKPPSGEAGTVSTGKSRATVNGQFTYDGDNQIDQGIAW